MSFVVKIDLFLPKLLAGFRNQASIQDGLEHFLASIFLLSLHTSAFFKPETFLAFTGLLFYMPNFCNICTQKLQLYVCHFPNCLTTFVISVLSHTKRNIFNFGELQLYVCHFPNCLTTFVISVLSHTKRNIFNFGKLELSSKPSIPYS